MDGDGERARGSFYEWKIVRPSSSPGSLFGSRRSRRCSPGEAPSPGAGELSPAGSRGGGGRRTAERRERIGVAGGLQNHRLSGLLEVGEGRFARGQEAKSNTFRIRFSPPTSPTSRSASQGLSPTAPYRIPPPGPPLRPFRCRGGSWGWGVRQGSSQRDGRDPKRKLSPPTRDDQRRLHRQGSQPRKQGSRVSAGRSSLTLLLFPIKSITLPSGS